MNDLRFAIRQLLKTPGFTAVALLTLALGIGANTAIFSVVDQLLVRPLPVTDPQRLGVLAQLSTDGSPAFSFNYPLFRDYQRENAVFRHLAASAERPVGLSTGGVTERQRALLVSGNYFAMLGVNAALGRTFATNEGVEMNDAPVLVLSHGLWRQRFGADPQVIGRSVTLNSRPFTVIGVAPREFTGTQRGLVPDLYVPITMHGRLEEQAWNGMNPLATRFFVWHDIMGRLKEGVTHGQAQAAMQILARQIHATTPDNTETNVLVLPGARGITHDLRDARLPLNLLLGTAGLVLLIACANLANLQLARATGRSRDFAIRIALGAGRGRLIRELLAESVLLALGGGLLGMLVAAWLVDVLHQFRPAGAPVEITASLDPRVLLFAFCASVFTGMLFGLAPALRASRPQIVPELKGGGGTTEARASRWNLRGGLVVSQIALSLLVLVSAGLCVRSLQKLQDLDPGFEPSRVVLLSFDLGLNNYTKVRADDFYDRLLQRVRALPGVEAASLANETPLSGSSSRMSVGRIEGYAAGPNEDPEASVNWVSSDYFRTLRVPLLRGRDFNATDTPASGKTVVVDDAFVKRYWPRQDPVGRHLFHQGEGGRETAFEVVGVVQSSRVRRLTDTPFPVVYYPESQGALLDRTLAVRTGLEPSATISLLRELAKSLDATVPIFALRTLAQQKDDSLALQRMAATLLSGFGVLALLLAALGIYGVLAYSVSRRTREIGVRMALGAQVVDVVGLVLRQGIGLVGVGLVLGLAGAFGATRLLRGFLYEVQPLDPLTFVTVIIVLSVVVLFACWLPARRAARLDPMEALRNE